MRALLGRLGIASLSLAFALLAGEGIIRWLAPQQLIEVDGPAIWRPDETFGWRHNEDIRARVNTGEGPVDFATDHRGYRVAPARSGTAPAISVLALGDSLIEALQVEADAAVPEVLGRLLTRRCGRQVAVANAGVSGWNPLQYRLEARRALGRERYGLGIVFVYPDNDTLETADVTIQPAQIMLPAQPRWPAALTWNEIVVSVLQPANDWLRTRSQMFLFVKLRLHPLLTKLGMTRTQPNDIYRVSERDSSRWAATASAASAVAEEFARYRTPVFFVLLPAPYQVHSEVLDQYLDSLRIPRSTVDLDQPAVMLSGAFADRGLEIVDVLPRMREVAASGRSLYGNVDRHLNVEGHRVVAEQIAPLSAAALGCAP